MAMVAARREMDVGKATAAAAAREAAVSWGQVELLTQQQLAAGLVPALGAQVPPPPSSSPRATGTRRGCTNASLRDARAA